MSKSFLALVLLDTPAIPDMFELAEAIRARHPGLPIEVERGGAVTTGLSAFVGREIEFETRKLTLATLIDKVGGLAVYLVEHGAVVKDGDTFGGDSRERFKVRYKNSDEFGGLPVFFCTDDLA